MNEDTGITINGDVVINFNEPSVDTGKSVQKLRLTNDSKKWKKRIKARDMNCQCCGEIGENGHLEVHHINPLAQYPKMATDDGNGIALCQKCHRKYHDEYKGNENAYTFALFLKRFGNRRY